MEDLQLPRELLYAPILLRVSRVTHGLSRYFRCNEGFFLLFVCPLFVSLYLLTWIALSLSVINSVPVVRLKRKFHHVLHLSPSKAHMLIDPCLWTSRRQRVGPLASQPLLRFSQNILLTYLY